jgi:uncharacterized protein (DUF486 family)
MPSRRAYLLVPAIAILAIILGCFVIGRHADHEAATRSPATCVSVGCYCEATATTGVRQPINAWSSLAPALAGALVLSLSLRREPKGHFAIARSRMPGVLLGIAACSISLFSFHYHATLTWLGEWLDGIALYLLAGFPIAWWCAREFRLGGRGFAWVYGALATAPAIASWLLPALRKPAFLLIVASAIVLVFANRKRTNGAGDRWLVVALVSFSIAMTAWILDATRTVCAPSSVLQLHSLWHLLSAPTIIALDRYVAEQRA